MAPEQVADAVERLAPQRLAVALQPQELGGRAVAAEPAAGVTLAGGMDHPGDDQRAGDAPFAALDAQVVEDVGEAEIVEGLETQALAADGARVLVLQGIEVDGGDFGLARLLLHRLDAEPPGPELGDHVLGCGLHVRRGFEQRGLAAKQRLGELGDGLPLLTGHRIVGAEIEQRPVAHPVADALGEHEAMASDRLPALSVWVLVALMYMAVPFLRGLFRIHGGRGVWQEGYRPRSKVLAPHLSSRTTNGRCGGQGSSSPNI